MVPKGIANKSAMIVARTATSSDNSSRIRISSMTGRSVHIEIP